MQVHTFIANSANEAVERIRTELGPAAVVLSVRKLPRTGLERFVKQDQIEVLAGIQPEPEAPAAEVPVTQIPTVDPLAEIRAEIQQLRHELRNRPRLEYNERPLTTRKNGVAHLLTQTGILPAFAE